MMDRFCKWYTSTQNLINFIPMKSFILPFISIKYQWDKEVIWLYLYSRESLLRAGKVHSNIAKYINLGRKQSQNKDLCKKLTISSINIHGTLIFLNIFIWRLTFLILFIFHFEFLLLWQLFRKVCKAKLCTSFNYCKTNTRAATSKDRI